MRRNWLAKSHYKKEKQMLGPFLFFIEEVCAELDYQEYDLQTNTLCGLVIKIQCVKDL